MNTYLNSPRAACGLAQPSSVALRRSKTGALTVLAASALVMLAPSISRAVPSFARQLNMDCVACHTEYPVLNQFGRNFKLTGYTAAADPATSIVPIAFMFQPSFTHTGKSQDGGAAPNFANNDNVALTQASVFYAGRLFGSFGESLFGKEAAAVFNKIGIFSQTTFDGVGKTWTWDNTELRYADAGTIAGKDALFGVYANNNPTMQDVWNSTPAWGYPFTGSHLSPGGYASPLIAGGFAQQVVGVGAYTFIDDTYYVDVGGYSTLSPQTQKMLGIDASGETQISGISPYWRIAVEKIFGKTRVEVGTFGMAGNTYPGRDQSAGKDRFTDIGIDSQIQYSTGEHDLSVLLSWIYEQQKWNASQALEATSNGSDSLRNLKATVNYLYDKTYGATVQYFSATGSDDAVLYSGSQTGSPNTDGFVFQFNYLPFNKAGGPAFWPKSNVKLSLQYTVYNKYNGARTNYDGAGANASDNDTLYLEAWIAF